jgi:FixJ family two-component response regulator
MPGMSGVELARQFKRLHGRIKVIYTSGYPVEEIGRQGVLMANTPFLEKPYRAQSLLRKMREVLDTGEV